MKLKRRCGFYLRTYFVRVYYIANFYIEDNCTKLEKNKRKSKYSIILFSVLTNVEFCFGVALEKKTVNKNKKRNVKDDEFNLHYVMIVYIVYVKSNSLYARLVYLLACSILKSYSQNPLKTLKSLNDFRA